MIEKLERDAREVIDLAEEYGKIADNVEAIVKFINEVKEKRNDDDAGHMLYLVLTAIIDGTALKLKDKLFTIELVVKEQWFRSILESHAYSTVVSSIANRLLKMR